MAHTRTRSSPMVPINAEALRHYRQVAGYSQRKLGQAAGIHHSLICKIEAGHRQTIHPETLVRLCDALGINDRTKLMTT